MSLHDVRVEMPELVWKERVGWMNIGLYNPGGYGMGREEELVEVMRETADREEAGQAVSFRLV